MISISSESPGRKVEMGYGKRGCGIGGKPGKRRGKREFGCGVTGGKASTRRGLAVEKRKFTATRQGPLGVICGYRG
jgi:hypothetical protein